MRKDIVKKPYWARYAPLCLFASIPTAVACGGGASLRQVQGAQFALSASEAETADQAEESQPPATDAAKRCEFWKHRSSRAHANSSGTMLEAWTEAKTNEACATIETDAPQLAQPCPTGPQPTPRPGQPPCVRPAVSATNATPPTPEPQDTQTPPDPATQVHEDPAQLLAELASAQPFNSQYIDFQAILSFVDRYAALASRQAVSDAAKQVHTSVALANGILSVPNLPIQLNNMTTSQFQLLTKNTNQAKLLANYLYTVIRIGGSLCQDFLASDGARLGSDSVRALQRQMASGGPQQSNLSLLNKMMQLL